MEKKYDYKNFNDLTDDKIFNIDLSWIYNLKLYNEISPYVSYTYNKDKFSDDITNDYIKNKKDALEKFKTVKNSVKN